ncbi:MAG: DUF192 domain-containing protein [Calditrichaeota bacterium]|nr:MAG: DUF192 domain-containing protein [Calditrichota bacterium]
MKVPKNTNEAKKRSRRTTLFDLLLILGMVAVLSWFYKHSVARIETIQESVSPDSLSVNKTGRVIFYDAQNRRNVEVVVEIAESDYEQQQGLMFRKNLPEGQGMLFIYPDEKERHFWMKNTEISLDMIFINSRYEIVKIQPYTRPLSEKLYPSEKPAQYVVEVPAGFCERYGIKKGQRITWERFGAARQKKR